MRIDWNVERQRFDEVAGTYHMYRPGYPPALIDAIVARAGLTSDSRILEVGSGTGKATEYFAQRGYSIHCVEPGINLLAVAAHHLQRYFHVSFSLTDFELWMPHDAAFDLVISAQAWHWITPEIGYSKAAQALKPGGTIALFWNFHPDPVGEILAALEAVYRERAPELPAPQPLKTTVDERQAALANSGYFSDIITRYFSWSQTYTTRQYLGLLNTHSDHLRLPEDRRQHLFEGIAAVIDERGGSIEKPYEAVVFMGSKTP